MLNIHAQYCGIVLLLLVTYFYMKFPKLNIRANRMYRVVLVMAYFCTVTDIISVVAIYYANVLSELAVRIFCKIYLFFLVSLIYCGLVYLFADIYRGKKRFAWHASVYGALLLVTAVLLFVLPIYYVGADDISIAYSAGPATLVVYIYFGLVLLALVFHTIRNRANIHPRRRAAISMWILVWVTAAIIQAIFRSLLIVSFAGCLGVLIMFCIIENPEIYLSRSSNFFNVAGLVVYLGELYGTGTQFSLIKTTHQEEHNGFYEAQRRHATVFMGSGEIYFIFEDKKAAGEFLLKMPTSVHKKRVYIVRDSSVAANAPELLYLLKEAQETRNREQLGDVVVIDERLKREILEWDEIGVLVEEAIRDDRIEVFYQPIYSVAEEKFRSAEALVRIRDKEGNIIPPGKFIPVAEDNKSIITLGRIIFDKVCDFLHRNDTDALGLKYVEINLSVVQAEDEKLANDVIDTMEKYAIESSRINLEITETASITGRAQLLKTMETLQGRSIYFSLDDFGTGQSNLDYMASMPVQIVKFDRSMTQAYFTSDKTRVIINAAIEMIHGMDMKIVSEGIETKEQLDEMIEKGVDFIQGYYFSKPVPEKEFVEFLKERNL